MTIISQLNRFEYKYFNCYKSQVYSLLKMQGIPTELLLFNSYESSSSVVEQYFKRDLERWKYETSCFSIDVLKQFKIVVHNKVADGFKSIFEEIKEKIDSGTCIILECDMYYLPYKTLYFGKTHLSHSIVISGYARKLKSIEFYILDDDSTAVGDYTLRAMDAVVLEIAFNSLGRKYSYLSYDINEVSEVIFDTSNRLFSVWCEQFNDDLELYDLDLQSELELGGLDLLNQRTEQMIKSFTLLSGSRHVFAQYTAFTEREPALKEKLQEYSIKAENFKNILLRFKLRGMFDFGKIAANLMILKELDCSIQENLEIRS